MAHKKVNFIPVKSSLISAVGYVKEDLTMYIKFNNKTMFSYHPVSEEDHKGFMKSNSVGKYFHLNIKSNEKFEVRNKTPKLTKTKE